jgi:hypothetical protein
VVDSVECPLQLYCWNKLAVLYSYDNESCIHAKHNVIMNMLWKEEDIHGLVQKSTCESTN